MIDHPCTVETKSDCDMSALTKFLRQALPVDAEIACPKVNDLQLRAGRLIREENVLWLCAGGSRLAGGGVSGSATLFQNDLFNCRCMFPGWYV